MAVMGMLMPVAGLIKVRYRGAKADIDSPFFKLHYRTTWYWFALGLLGKRTPVRVPLYPRILCFSTLLFIACILVTANDLIGNTIDCISGNLPGNVLNTYCWIMSTFTVPGTTPPHPR